MSVEDTVVNIRHAASTGLCGLSSAMSTEKEADSSQAKIPEKRDDSRKKRQSEFAMAQMATP